MKPSIKFRYLQVRMNKKDVDMLYHLYPEFVSSFDEYENILYDIALSIYKSYVDRFIKKQHVIVPKDEYSVIKECHAWHLSNRVENRISVDKIIRVMNNKNPSSLNHMIRRSKLEKSRLESDPDKSNQSPVCSPIILSTKSSVVNVTKVKKSLYKPKSVE